MSALAQANFWFVLAREAIQMRSCIKRYKLPWAVSRVPWIRPKAFYIVFIVLHFVLTDVFWYGDVVVRAREPTDLNRVTEFPRRQVFRPTDRAARGSKSRAMAKAAPIQIPEPENVTIGEDEELDRS